MYLRLGNTVIKYTSSREDFLVLGQIIHSGMGYESPVLVQSIDDLDIWFGKEFEERDWMIELLKSTPDLSLLLSPPLSSESRNKDIEGYIDYEKFPIASSQYYNADMFPPTGEEGIIYRVLLDISGEKYEDYIWTGEFYISVQDLPQNSDPESSSSLDNRDTLRLGWINESKEEWRWCYPEFKNIQKDLEIKNSLNWNKVDLKKIDTEEETIAFDLILPEPDTFTETIEGRNNPYYLILDKIIYYSGLICPVIDQRYYESQVKVESREELVEKIKESGWEYSEEENLIWKQEGSKITYFYSWEGLELTPNLEKTREIIAENISPMISFWSRTIGRPRKEEWEEDNITLKIEKVDINGEITWRATISRYDYLEVFEGTLTQSSNRLDYVIEAGSKLIHAYIPESIQSLEELPEGTWELRGGKYLRSSNDPSYDIRKTLDWLIRENREFYPDFFMISDPEEWMNEYNSERIYQWLLEKAKIGSFQFLIQNTEENLKWNYLGDKENRLIWFYNPILVNGNKRPGYYLFLLGLFQDIYSMTSKYILYNVPEKNPYEDNSNSEKLLKDFKSNYLVCNNQIYYYKEYQNGNLYSTTLLMRFVMGKISRELMKSMEIYLGCQRVGEIVEAIRNILNKVKSRFNIIRSITIEDYLVSFSEQKINLILNTSISDLKSNNMTLDININYNKSYS